jgi:hypothetical protein
MRILIIWYNALKPYFNLGKALHNALGYSDFHNLIGFTSMLEVEFFSKVSKSA